LADGGFLSPKVSQALIRMTDMDFDLLDQAEKLVEKFNADLEPELVTREVAHDLLQRYARINKRLAFGEAVLAAKLDDAAEVARLTGTSVGKARETVETAKSLPAAPELAGAFAGGRGLLGAGRRHRSGRAVLSGGGSYRALAGG
jgi:hypothetical protein